MDRRILLLGDPDQELKLIRRERDDSGGWHLRLAQQYQGLAVWPSTLNVHLDAAGNVNLLEGAYIPSPIQVDIEPAITAAEATERPRARVSNGTASRVRTRPK